MPADQLAGWLEKWRPPGAAMAVAESTLAE